MSQPLNVVILAGGVGSRLYPISTPELPKYMLRGLIPGIDKSILEMLDIYLTHNLSHDSTISVVCDDNFKKLFPPSYYHYISDERKSGVKGTLPAICNSLYDIMNKESIYNPDIPTVFLPADICLTFKETNQFVLPNFLDAISITCDTKPPYRKYKDIILCGYRDIEKDTIDYMDSSLGNIVKYEGIFTFHEKPSIADYQSALKRNGLLVKPRSTTLYFNMGIFIFYPDAIYDYIHRTMELLECSNITTPLSFDTHIVTPLFNESRARVYEIAYDYDWYDVGTPRNLYKMIVGNLEVYGKHVIHNPKWIEYDRVHSHFIIDTENFLDHPDIDHPRRHIHYALKNNSLFAIFSNTGNDNHLYNKIIIPVDHPNSLISLVNLDTNESNTTYL